MKREQNSVIVSPRHILACPTDAQIRAAAEARVHEAMRRIENAQNELLGACQMLSAITYGHPTCKVVSKMYDQVRSLWYRVQNFSYTTRYRLDSVNVEELARNLAKRGP